jgi:quercetin 2,3-dioxygenase
MNRKDFIRKGLIGAGVSASLPAIASLISNQNDELKEIDLVGFNHLPQSNNILMGNMVLHKAETRGHADHGWLNSYHTFSFASYYNPERMHFGVLRVLNDDQVQAGMGFSTHPHDNMEIISIPLEGDLEHKDSMGNVAVIRNGDVQVMSAGTGITHSEYNKNRDKQVKFLQIWVFPNKRDVKPRYDQLTLKAEDRKNKLQQIISPNPDDEGVWLHQEAWFHLGQFDSGRETIYSVKRKGNGVYAFLLSGAMEINGQKLMPRDGLGIWDANQLSLKSLKPSEILLMDLPMQL